MNKEIKQQTIEEIFKDCNENNKENNIYFHNLKADASYIIEYLLKNKED